MLLVAQLRIFNHRYL